VSRDEVHPVTADAESTPQPDAAQPDDAAIAVDEVVTDSTESPVAETVDVEPTETVDVEPTEAVDADVEPAQVADEPTPVVDADVEPTEGADADVEPAVVDADAAPALVDADVEPAHVADEPTVADIHVVAAEVADADVEPAVVDADVEQAQSVAEAPSADAAPIPAPVPSPGPARVAAPAAAVSPAALASRMPRRSPATSTATQPWGRVDDDGTVSVREGDDWRVVGQFPDGSPQEALAYFERKYADLAAEVGLVEVRHRRGGASASELRHTVSTVRAKIVDAAAVGDLAALAVRLDALDSELTTASAAETAAAREAVDEAIRTRTAVVEQAESIAARDPRSIQWKQTSAEVNALFEQWQSQQANGPRLPKSVSQQLWKRFRDARAIIDKHRREFYSELDETHRAARDRKSSLVEKAEALSAKGEDGIGAYRDLLDQWKAAGRAGKKADDALWARFKAAGDALYGARAERETAEVEASREKIEAKRALLDEARTVADESDLAKARAQLTGIQRRWDEIGRIFPRERERGLDDDLRKIEQALRSREDTDWKRNNPETKARANDMTRQLTEAIEKLEAELAAAEKSGDKRAVAKAAEALDARKAWLKAVGG
jgi:hypothetical protein